MYLTKVYVNFRLQLYVLLKHLWRMYAPHGAIEFESSHCITTGVVIFINGVRVTLTLTSGHKAAVLFVMKPAY